MSYNVRRNPKTGYVALYDISRIKGSNKQKVEYIAGFGVMSKTEFVQFKKYAHGIRDQNKRLQILLSDSRCVKERESLPKKSVQKVTQKQKKQARRGFRYPKQTEEDIKEDIERYKRNVEKERKEKESKMTHTERMMMKRDKRRHEQIKASHGMDLSKYHSNRERINVLNDRIKEIDKYIDYQNRNIRNASQKFAIDRDRLPEYQYNRSTAIEAKEILKEQKRGLER